MRVAIIIAGILSLCVASAPVRADHSMVLITHVDSPIDTIKPLVLRKIYLGFHVTEGDGVPIRAIINRSSNTLWEIFLQDVMGMSARSYDRRLLALTLQSGRIRPQMASSLDEILEHLRSDEHAIAFAWEEDIENEQDFKIVRVLWRR